MSTMKAHKKREMRKNHFSVFLIEIAAIPVRTEHKPLCPSQRIFPTINNPETPNIRTFLIQHA